MKHQKGFSLLEVVIALGFLMTLTVAVTTMLRAGFDVKEGLSQRARVLHRMSVAMDKVARDLEHVFLVPPKDTLRNGIGRSTKTVFAIEEGGDTDRLLMTTKSKRPRIKGKPESDLTFIVYEIGDAKDIPGRKNLYRAESSVIPLDLKEEPSSYHGA
jgi:type II secretory pathway component PulJ